MKIIMLAGQGISTKLIYNALKSDFNIDKVLMTKSPSKKKLIKRRLMKLGGLYVLNQLLFQLIVVNILKLFSYKRYRFRLTELNLDDSSIDPEKIIEVGDVNSTETIYTLNKLKPDVVIVNGTSIISSKVLESINAQFINTHVGITPQYRGVHGGYWALRNNDNENFGVTVHIVDKGIDTGSIVYQMTTIPIKQDNFITYPLLQYALAIPLLKQTLEDIKMNRLKTYSKKGFKSNLYYHPTITKYLTGLILHGVK